MWPLREPAIFDRAKQIDERMMGGGDRARHVFDLMPSGESGLRGLAESLELATR